jgi:hypothetical protein
MIFAAPWLLLALAALPLLWWLLRVTPPAPKDERFPAIRLLAGLRATEETPSRTPPWLLLLRIIAAGLVIVGLARPILDAGAALPGDGPILLVMDDGWAAAADWPARLQAADAVLDRAERAGRRAALLTLARSDADAPPALTPVLPIADLRARLAALRPKPWASDRAAAATALAAWSEPGTAIAYLPDGLASPDDAAFDASLRKIGPIDDISRDQPVARLLAPPKAETDGLALHVSQLAQPTATPLTISGQSGDGRTLARLPITVAAGATTADAALILPPELRNQLARLVLDGPAADGSPTAGSVVLLDERWRRRPVGLVAGDAAAADTPLTGQLYYIRQALAPFTELRTGDLASLLSRDISVLVLADRPVTDPTERDTLSGWVRQGGVLIRFAGPRMAELTADANDDLDTPSPNGGADALLPVKLLAGDRQLGGALSWGKPAGLAAFPAASPFASLAVPAEVTVSRQVLAEPSADLPAHSWALLADGTPLVTERSLGTGRIVLFHTTANADWSNLALSGLFVDMLRRLVELSAGIATPPGDAILAPAETLDGFGQPVAPPPIAAGLAADTFTTTAPSPRHPPGLYGPDNARQALNLSAAITTLKPAAEIAGARHEALGGAVRERALGPWLLGAALALLALDLLISLRLRGLLSLKTTLRPGLTLLMLATLAHPALAQQRPTAASNVPAADQAALTTRLAYILSNDPPTDEHARAGLAGLSDYVNRRTAANLGDPAGITPGQDDLSFYPLLYWPLSGQGDAPSTGFIAALNAYMSNGGIILIDSMGGDDALLQRAARGLQVPRLTQLTTDHVLARSFYLLDSFPGRDVGAPVWVQRDQDRTNDSVTPVIIGTNDWAGAWAISRQNDVTLQGGARQRVMAFRFGVNLVMYALTGNYKGDQVHVPAILERLGQ